MTTIKHSDVPRKGPGAARILLMIVGLIVIAGWIGAWISFNENEDKRQPLKSWQEYPKAMRITQPATGYHYPYANQIQQVVQFRPGQAVKVIQKDGQWYQIRISGDQLCWVNGANLTAR